MKLDRIRLEILKKDKESVVLSVQNICRMWGLCDFYFYMYIYFLEKIHHEKFT